MENLLYYLVNLVISIPLFVPKIDRDPICVMSDNARKTSQSDPALWCIFRLLGQSDSEQFMMGHVDASSQKKNTRKSPSFDFGSDQNHNEGQ